MKRIFGKSSNSKSTSASSRDGPTSPPPDAQPQAGGPLLSDRPQSSPPPPTGNAQNGTQLAGVAQLPPPPHVRDVSGAIGWSAAMPVLDTAYLLQLAEYCSTSSSASKDAAKALRKELKFAVPQAQERALRVLLVLMRNSDHRFRQHVAAKKFIDELRELGTSKKTDDKVRETLLQVLSALAWDYQKDADLSPITALYNKLKHSAAPLNGAPLSHDDPLLAPSSVPYLAQTRGSGGGGRPRTHQVPSDAHHLATQRALARETSQAATMLHEAVAFAAPETNLKREELVQEFLGSVNRGVVELNEGMAWIHSVAERKRDDRVERQQVRAAQVASRASMERREEHGKLGSNNPFKRIVEGSPPQRSQEQLEPPAQADEDKESDEERTLALVLKAHTEGIEALKLYESHLAHHQELAELREVQERSMLDTRFDRSKAGTPDPDGIYHSDAPLPGEGTSNANPAPRERVSSNPYAAYLTPKRQSSEATSPPTSPQRPVNLLDGDVDEGPEYTDSPLASPANIEGAYGGLGELNLGLGTPPRVTENGSMARMGRSATSGSEVIPDPTEPSDKALGKLRRVSVRENSESDAEERQRELEAKLRAKYTREQAEGGQQ